MTSTIDQSIVDRFVTQAAAATPAQRTEVARKMRIMIAAGETAKNPVTGGRVSLETMAATADALEAM